MKKRLFTFLLVAVLLLTLASCKEKSDVVIENNKNEKTDIISELGLNSEIKGATEHTVQINSAVYSLLDFENTQEADFATRGLIDAPEVLELKNESGKVIWSQKAYSFLSDHEKAPDTVNPSLWENTKNNHAYGLFKVTDNIYQVRGYDMANLTVIKGDTGWILFDPLMSCECSEAAMQLIEKNLGQLPIKAVIISHSHADHFGGIKGVMTSDDAADSTLTIEEQLTSGKIPIIVPEGFTQHAVSENIYAGRAMARRANYQYGTLLTPGAQGSLSIGIGMGQSKGVATFILPTYEIKTTREVINIDGVDFEFQLTPGTEAPAEMNTWIPKFNALWMAENCTGTLHNLYTLRGAQIRDGAAWAKYITEAISLYGDKALVVFQSHNWPHWGNDVINDYMVNTAAVYKFINDQTLTYINQGYTSDEISNMIKLPQKLAENWYTRQYYGTVAHNSKAVYQKYMGWYDANPVNLNPLEPTENAKKWVEYLGDIDEVLRLAKKDFEKGQYQWVAEITNVIVFADPSNMAARLLCADAMEQLGYQAESGPWRNAYLTAALELRNGNSATSSEVMSDGSAQQQMTPAMMFDYFGILLDKQALSEYDFTMNIKFLNNEKHMLRVKDGVLLHYENSEKASADVNITCPQKALFYILQNNMDGFKSVSKIEGNTELFELFVSKLNQLSVSVSSTFNIIEP